MVWQVLHYAEQNPEQEMGGLEEVEMEAGDGRRPSMRRLQSAAPAVGGTAKPGESQSNWTSSDTESSLEVLKVSLFDCI